MTPCAASMPNPTYVRCARCGKETPLRVEQLVNPETKVWCDQECAKLDNPGEPIIPAKRVPHKDV
jgi:hypothetical protein